jgi:hypothetical protein
MGSSHTQVTLVTVTNQVFQKATLPLYGVLQRPDHTLDGFSGFIVLPKRGGIRWNSQCFMVVFTLSFTTWHVTAMNRDKKYKLLYQFMAVYDTA